ncbi:MAG: HAMP domain-containing histidine kinase [Planctomycetes bacterium]|nr:HAMP domain-containing histidine kinase [Planctomycetota bacterium]
MRQGRRARTAPLLVAGGALALTAYGLFALQRDVEAEHLRARERARQTVRLVAESLARDLDRLAADLGARAPDPGAVAALDAFTAERPFVELAFALDAAGKVLHPTGPATAPVDSPPESERVRVESWLEEAAFREFARADPLGAEGAFDEADRAANDPGLKASVALARACHDLRRGDRSAALGRLAPVLETKATSSSRARALARLARVRLLRESGDLGGGEAETVALLDDLEAREVPDARAFLAELDEAGALRGASIEAAASRIREASRRRGLLERLAGASDALLSAGGRSPVGEAIAVLAPRTAGGRTGLLVSPERFLAAAFPASGALARVEGLPVQGSAGPGSLEGEAEVAGTGGLLRVGLPRGFEPAAPATGARPFLLGALLVLLGGTIAGAAALTARAARREVEAARAKSDFLSAVTHELKTPLASIRLYGEMLEDGKGAPEGKRREWVGAIRRESERLSDLIDRVLALGRRERRGPSGALAPVAAGGILRTAAETFGPVADRSGARFEVEVAEEEASVRAEPSGIVQALLDLLDNAIKHGGEKPEVLLRGLRDGTTYRFEVADRGPGIPPGEAEAIFDLFARGSDAVADARQGLGVGLALARRIVEANGGTLSVAPREGGGSVFTLALPAEESAS